MEEKKKNVIRILSDVTINQIAAGEVIENAASVVKELVENALDAGCTEITVETTGGGQGQIVVKDNGCGMVKEDLFLAVERHATSKISSAEDLFALSSLGFRGEAMASIASVSKLTLHSSTATSMGSVLHVEGGKILSCQDLPRRRGTTVTVTSLFYNVPARKKFQKSEASESVEINKTLTQSALSHPEVAFTWINEGKTIWEAREGEERIAHLLGKEFATHVSTTHHSDHIVEVKCHLVHPSQHRPNRTGQYLFVNSRSLTSPLISECVQEGYGTRLPSNRFPLFVLKLQCPPETIDVNIHPRKKEIRFREEKKVREVILKAVREGLEERNTPQIATKISFPPIQTFSLSSGMPLERRERPEAPPSFTILSLLGPYIVVKESEEEILVVDAARARGRIFFEKLEGRNEEIAIQNLLFPLTIEKNSAEKAKLELHMEYLNDLGIAIRSFGGNAFLIDAYPDIFSEAEVLTLLDDLLEELNPTHSDHNQKKALLLFCRRVRKTVSTFEEGTKLLEELYRCKEPGFCPEMKPTTLRLTPKEISKWF